MATDELVTRGPAVLAVTAATLVCCTVFVLFRLISRFGIVKKPGWDDYFMILAWILAFGTSFSICYGTRYGLGRHEHDIPRDWSSPMKKTAYVFSVLYNPALMATKTSILTFYLTLSKTHKVFRWATIATMVVVNVGGLALTLLNTLQCSPVSAAYLSPTPDTASCTSIVTIYLSSAPLNIITDLAILFLPMPILTSMRLPKKQKTILVVTFGFGIFVAVVDVVRIAYLQKAARDNLRAVQMHQAEDNTDSRDANDFSWYASLSFMWSAIEINVGIMCGCVPALKPLASRFLPHWILDHTIRDKSTTNTSDDMVLHPDIIGPGSGSRGRSNQSDPCQPPVSPLTTRPPPVAMPAPQHGPEEHIDMMDFLTTPNSNEMPQLQQMTTFATYNTGGRTRRGSVPFFDFVNVGKRKNITLRTNRESIFPILMVTLLFFIWGFAYGLLDALNARFQQIANMSHGQTVAQHSAYYVGYIVGPLTFGRLVFRYWGFKACYTVGLLIYACGTLVFWPSAVLTSFPAFLISNFIVGLGLSTLEISANPFIALCGPPEYAEVRLNLSQGVQAVGSILSPLLAKKVLFKASPNSLIDVQWTYLGISIFTVILAICYYYVPLPEATDKELEDASARLPIPRDAEISLGTSKVKVIYITLGIAIFSQFCYVGGQESVSTTFAALTQRVAPGLETVSHQAYGHTGFAVGRFLAAFLNIWIKPRYLLLFFYLGAIAFAAAVMAGHDMVPAAMIVLLMFFEGPLFAYIFVQPLRGMGKHTKDASALLTAAIGGGAIVPPIMYGALKAHNAQYAFCVVIAFYAAGTLFPVWLNLYSIARKLSDPVRDERTRRESELEQRSRQESMPTSEKKRMFSAIFKRLSISGNKGAPPDSPPCEHRERSSWTEARTPTSRPTTGAVESPSSFPTYDDSPTFETMPIWLEGAPNGRANHRTT
ncbi:MFS general substrate transporter [Aaosphaeria arxii CBS 175.79]|uniref:MFS general substrate transporter n=1 Tax=Aaosphaeria arxii CBS 175.79 TaxID=1450172 RepID=A0A6A5XZG7_9PLEO|nr:MFS general substrate transporter [Aaosphaeria arxii CBS 175.79]KAF2018207.1 MFS general substrate transporter [Aaosphaeria arxii CBS 175.79]